jgi:hypothetical protein
MTCRAIIAAALSLLSHPAVAGTYTGSNSSTDCNGVDCNIFIIVHPIGYTSAGIGGEIEVPVCTRPGDSPFVQRAVDEAIRAWNELTPTTGNCIDCASAGDSGPPGGVFIMETVTIHEFGHCAMGLGHTNFRDPVTGVIDSFTAGKDVATNDAGTDTVRGSRDDIVTPDPLPPPPNALPLHWFRIADNDPVAIDGTVIDSSSYAIFATQLPAGSTWAANGNRYVSALLGAGDDTQNVMHAIAARNMRYLGLTADDANTVRHGMTGLDRIAGTADDYTIRLVLVDDCSNAEIEVQYEPLGPQIGGLCTATLDYIGPEPPPPAGRIHFALTALDPPFSRILVQVNSEVDWGIFYDGFETGDLARWPTQ